MSQSQGSILAVGASPSEGAFCCCCMLLCCYIPSNLLHLLLILGTYNIVIRVTAEADSLFFIRHCSFIALRLGVKRRSSGAGRALTYLDCLQSSHLDPTSWGHLDSLILLISLASIYTFAPRPLILPALSPDRINSINTYEYHNYTGHHEPHPVQPAPAAHPYHCHPPISIYFCCIVVVEQTWSDVLIRSHLQTARQTICRYNDIYQHIAQTAVYRHSDPRAGQAKDEQDGERSGDHYL